MTTYMLKLKPLLAEKILHGDSLTMRNTVNVLGVSYSVLTKLLPTVLKYFKSFCFLS